MGILGLLMIITFGLLIHTTIIRCLPCLIQVNRTIVEGIVTMVIRRICRDVQDLLLDIIIMDMEVHTLPPHLQWATTLALLHHHTIALNKVPTQILFHQVGVRDQLSPIRRRDQGKSEQSRVCMMEVEILSLFPCRIPFEEQTVAVATALRQPATPLISPWASHQISVIDHLLEIQTFFLLCLAQPISLTNGSVQLFEGRIPETRQRQV
mmetsp:Transcript_27183/g.59844  ORF Transcript_27183/g.59844 Transcript_27183/m.59844 type:complete len:209 (-) Transcript_27183:2133-2759(-)